MRAWILTAATVTTLLGQPVFAEDRAVVPPRGAVVHVVIEGETLEAIARLYGLTPSELRSANPTAAWREGDSVVVGRPTRGWPTHSVQAGETLWRIGKGYGIGVEQLKQANNLSDNTLMPGNVLTLPRAVKPTWTPPEPAAPPLVTVDSAITGNTASPSETTSTYRPASTAASTKPLGAWVEVRLPDNRRAWAPAEGLVIGSWQPQEASRVIDVGRSFMGVPYKWGGVDPNGWDCSGFVQEVFRLGGHQVPRLADAQYEACEKVSVDSLVPGDLVFF